MAFTEIIKEIRKNSDKICGDIVKSAEERAAAMEKVSSKNQIERESEWDKETKAILDTRTAKVNAKSSAEKKRAIDRAGHDLVEKVFEEARKELLEMPDENYRSLLAPYLRQIPETFSGSAILPHKRSAITKKILAECGITIKKVEEHESLSGGVILTDESSEYNLSFDALLKEARSKHEMKVASILFNKD